MTENKPRPLTTREVISRFGCEAACLYKIRDRVTGELRPAAPWPTTATPTPRRRGRR